MLKLLPYISTYSGLLPLLAGVLFARSKLFILFTFFILIGLVADLSIAYCPSNELSHLIMFLYSLVDFMLLFYITGRIIYPKLSIRIQLVVAIGITLFWAICYKMWEPWQTAMPQYSYVFDVTMQILIAVFTAYVLIRITEGFDDSLTQRYLFLLIGIFFYNFCTFFIHSFMHTDFVEHMWFVSCIINIVSMLIYTYAMYRQSKVFFG